LVEFLRR